MAEIPTYVIGGEITRFDERDTVFSREALVEGSPEEIEYHGRYPEKIEVDRRLARFIVSKMEGAPGTDDVAQGIYESQFIPSASLALPDMVDGVPSERRTEWSPREAKRKIKEFALFLGAGDVRIGPLRKEWVYSHRGSRPFFDTGYTNPPYFKGVPDRYQGAKYGEKIELDHKSAVSMAFPQSNEMIATGTSRAVDLETGNVYSRSVLASVQLARFIRALGYPARAHHLRNYCLLAVPVAVDSGIGELARSGYLVSRRFGANFRLATVTTDMPLEYDEPVDIGIQDFCEKCKKCAVNCPSGAIEKGKKTLVRGIWKWQIDPEACLLYWGKAGYTCSICQSVCPWTKPRTFFHRTVATIAVKMPWMRRALVFGDDLVYGARFRPRPLPRWLDDSED
ncbi:MAG: reductive dehalogenase [Candidatus Krumholzibacteriota bacterium]|nr:reductive dehalogenase [Candidatus Krumholzibacteriota bacterium]